MADSDLPHVHAPIDGIIRRVELIAYVHTRQGPMARVCWREPIGDTITPITATVPREKLRAIPGVDYSGVPEVGTAPVRGGRVATGNEWRRTG